MLARLLALLSLVALIVFNEYAPAGLAAAALKLGFAMVFAVALTSAVKDTYERVLES